MIRQDEELQSARFGMSSYQSPVQEIGPDGLFT